MHDARSNPTPPLPTLLDINQLAEHLGVTVRHVRRLVAERRIPYVKWGHLLRFDPTAIAGWLDQQRIEPSTGTRPLSHPLGIVPAAEPRDRRRTA
jgi:excisionase family DNA binding protein